MATVTDGDAGRLSATGTAVLTGSGVVPAAPVRAEARLLATTATAAHSRVLDAPAVDPSRLLVTPAVDALDSVGRRPAADP